jgi:electron transport complex protein RnfG
MKKSIQSTLVLVCICAVISLILAATNAITAPIIAKNQSAAASKALLVVMPDGRDFTSVDLSTYTLPATVTEAWTEAGGGYVITLNTTGYSSGMIIMCGIRADGTVSGATCLSSGETLGYEKTFGENFKGLNAESVAAVDTVTGATRTTSAYRAAVQDALNAAIILGGGSVDIRTEEEILADALNEALPAGEGKFTKVFLTEVLEGIDAVYAADNGRGHVCVIGEQFVAVDENGTVLSAVDPAVSENASAQIAKLAASTLTDLDLTAYADLPGTLVAAQKTASGNYVLEIKGAGYGINGGNEYYPASGEYILIRVSMTAQGQIIDCLTVSQKETDGIGSVCADESFYGQFVGKTEETYEQIDAISGATMTTNGYKKAILRAFEAVKILEGGAKQ